MVYLLNNTLVDSTRHYRYTKIRSNTAKTLTFWRCIHRKTCNGSCTTNFFESSRLQIKSYGQGHTHASEEAEIKADKLVRGMKRKATELPNERPIKIVQTVLQNVHDSEVLVKLPERRYLYRTINRQQHTGRPPIPHDLQSLEIPEEYRKTKKGEPFFQYDNHDSNNRILMFYTKGSLRQLCNSRQVFSDGTFKTPPRLFYQMYTFHTIVFDHAFPVVYILTTRKTRATYIDILEQIKEAARSEGFTFEPQTFLCDFELAMMQAINQVLPGVTVKGCHFHWTQSVWRRVIGLGLLSQYQQDENEGGTTRDSVNLLLALPFLPLDELHDVFNNLRDSLHDQVKPVWDYISRTYVNSRRSAGRRRRLLAPRYLSLINASLI